jgi:glycosyltransferase involved in cell wall biosynthesis
MPSPERHIGLSAHLLSGRATYRSAGIHHYLSILLAHLPATASGLRLTAFVGPSADVETQHAASSPAASLRLHRSRWPTGRPAVRILWEQLALPWIARQARLDALHALAFVAPALAPCRTIVTVYDLSFLHYPAYFRLANRLYLQTFTGPSCRRAAHVIAISRSTKDDVVRQFGLPPERVSVVYPGCEPQYRPLPPAQVEAFRQARGLPPKFILYLGTLEPRKNVAALVRAFTAARRPGLKLVLAGAEGWLFDDLYRTIEQSGLAGDVILPGYVPAEDKPLWYNAAHLFVYPSEYEGFGLPVLEALACGVPVVAADTSSLPEVAGSAACLVPPRDPAALAEALDALLADAPRRAELAAAGPAQAARFSWPEAAARTAAVYRRVTGATN